MEFIFKFYHIMHNLDQICIRNKITNWVHTMFVPQNVDIYGFCKISNQKSGVFSLSTNKYWWRSVREGV